jgi:hypothetical protein
MDQLLSPSSLDYTDCRHVYTAFYFMSFYRLDSVAFQHIPIYIYSMHILFSWTQRSP